MKTDIGIYTTREKIQHKIDKAGNPEWEIWWTLPFRAKLGMSLSEFIDSDAVVNKGSPPLRFWVGFEKHWQGHFKIRHIEGNDIFLGEWIPIAEPHYYKCNHFQGFTYKCPTILPDEGVE